MNEMKLMMAEMELAKMASAAAVLQSNASSKELVKMLKDLEEMIAKVQNQVVIEQSR